MNAKDVVKSVLKGHINPRQNSDHDKDLDIASDEVLYFLLKDFDVIPKKDLEQRQDSLTDQIHDVMKQATKMGCYDAHDWIRESFNGE